MLKKHLSDSTDSILQNLGFGLHSCDELIETLTSTLKEEAPVSTTKGDFIADGFSEELDELRNLRKSGKDHLNKITIAKNAALGHRLWRCWTSQGVTKTLKFVIS